MAAECLLKDLVQLGGVVLRPARRAADASSQTRCRRQHEREHSEAHEAQFPVVVQEHEQQPQDYEGLPQQVGQNVRGGYLNFFDVVHDGRHQFSSGIRFEELRALANDLLEHAVAQVGYR